MSKYSLKQKMIIACIAIALVIIIALVIGHN